MKPKSLSGIVRNLAAGIAVVSVLSSGCVEWANSGFSRWQTHPTRGDSRPNQENVQATYHSEADPRYNKNTYKSSKGETVEYCIDKYGNEVPCDLIKPKDPYQRLNYRKTQ